jgi:hypothetical protein
MQELAYLPPMEFCDAGRNGRSRIARKAHFSNAFIPPGESLMSHTPWSLLDPTCGAQPASAGSAPRTNRKNRPLRALALRVH